MQQLEAYVAVLQHQGPETDQGQPGSAAAFIDMHIRRLQQQPKQSASTVTLSAPVQYKQEPVHQQIPMNGPTDAAAGIPQKESSLDRVTAALQHALDAATSSTRSVGSSRRATANGGHGSSWQGPGQRMGQHVGPDLAQQHPAPAEAAYGQRGGPAPSLVGITAPNAGYPVMHPTPGTYEEH